MKNFKRDYVLDQESSFCTLQPKKDTCKGEEFKEGNLSSLFTLGKLSCQRTNYFKNSTSAPR